MRHKVAGYKLGRNTAHRRSLLRNLVTSVIVEERVETTVPKAKAARPIVEKMITLGKRGDLAARRLAGAYLMTDEALVKLFDTVGPRFGDREGGHTRVIRTGWNKGDGADKAFLELLGSEKVLDEKREKRAEARAKKVAEAKKAMEDAEAQAQHDGGVEPVKEESEDKKEWPRFWTEGTARAVPFFFCAQERCRAADSSHALSARCAAASGSE
jgi:large subunit ribosomal protein L17